MKTYKQRQAERQQIITDAHLIRAFSEKQLEENADYQKAVKNGEKLYSYCGGLITKSNADKMFEAQRKSDKEFEELTKNEDFLFEAMKYELSNHEYCYDRDFDVFHYLGVKSSPYTMGVFLKAKKAYFDGLDER